MSKRLQLCPHDREWLETFEAERERITAALGSLLLQIEHVGSTSVPGLLAKPVVDIAVAVGSITEADLCIEPLQALGYEYRGLHGDDKQRRYYVLEREGRRVVQIHLWIVPAAGWDRMLRFREVLRANAAVREAYAREKLRIAEMVNWDKAGTRWPRGHSSNRSLSALAMVKTFLSACGILVLLLLLVSGQQPSQEKPSSKPVFEFEKDCGNPVVESMAWRLIRGTVIRVIDGDTVKLVTDNGDNRIVNLVAIDTSSAKEAARSLLSRLVLDRKVDVLVNPSKSEDRRLVGVIQLSMRDINRELLEAGVAKYQAPAPYSVSGYTACGYSIVEGKAREAKKGIWGRLNH